MDTGGRNFKGEGKILQVFPNRDKFDKLAQKPFNWDKVAKF